MNWYPTTTSLLHRLDTIETEVDIHAIDDALHAAHARGVAEVIEEPSSRLASGTPLQIRISEEGRLAGIAEAVAWLRASQDRDGGAQRASYFADAIAALPSPSTAPCARCGVRFPWFASREDARASIACCDACHKRVAVENSDEFREQAVAARAERDALAADLRGIRDAVYGAGSHSDAGELVRDILDDLFGDDALPPDGAPSFPPPRVVEYRDQACDASGVAVHWPTAPPQAQAETDAERGARQAHGRLCVHDVYLDNACAQCNPPQAQAALTARRTIDVETIGLGWRNDGADGETVHLLCDEIAALRAELALRGGQ